MSRPCPRRGCANPMTGGDLVVCAADFMLLASMCRGKKPIGEPLAAWIESQGGGGAYRCPVCRQWHNGGKVREVVVMELVADRTIEALLDDPRVGRQGLLQLADAWGPDNVSRSAWAEGLDQGQALVLT